MVFQKVLFLRSNMQSFSFIGHTLMELSRNLTIDDKFINKRVRLFIHQTMCREGKKYYYVITRLQNSTFLKKNTEAATESAEAVTGAVL